MWKSYLINAVSSNDYAKKYAENNEKKGENFKKNCKYSILDALHAMYENVKIENPVPK